MECSLELLDREPARFAAGPRRGRPHLFSVGDGQSKGEVGLDIDIAKVPLREADMEPFEIMVSESQERMLCVVEPQPRSGQSLEVCEKWEVLATADR